MRWPRCSRASTEPNDSLTISCTPMKPRPMRFSESWKMAASVSLRISSAGSDCSAARAMAELAVWMSPRKSALSRTILM